MLVSYGRFGKHISPILKGLVQEYIFLLGQLDPSRSDALLRNVGKKRNYAKKIQKYAAVRARDHAELIAVKLGMKALLFVELESLISCMRNFLY
jgi:hypothetical protein